jgi:Inner membrane component domain
MRIVLNIIWLIFAGIWMFIAYAIAALICFILIITIPFGVAALRIGIFGLWPFRRLRRDVLRRDALDGTLIGCSRRIARRAIGTGALLDEYGAAGDVDDDAADPCGAVRGEEQGRLRDVLRGA